jgi:alkaline phosphatase
MKKSVVYFLLLSACFAHPAKSQDVAPAYKIHSHNDYEQPIPFWTAYYAKAGSIEVDIYLEKGQILVGHDKEDLRPERTIQALYLDPIRQQLKQYQGKLAADNTYELQLLVDIKSPTNPCLDTLIAVLKNYPELINSKQLQIVLSGNKPPVADFGKYPSFILYDGLPWENYAADITDRVPLLSANLRKYTSWGGKGIIPARELEALKKVILETHQKGKKIRFWNAPDFINAWYELGKLGVDYMNTDHIPELAGFMEKYKSSSFTNTSAPGSMYQPSYKSDGSKKAPKNIILLIGDGMGLAHIHAGYTANFNQLNLYQFRATGLSRTSSYDSYITDSAPGSTAFSAGIKTNNRAVGVDHTGVAVPLLPVLMNKKGKKTAVITTGDVSDATPADFYAHQSERNSSEAILRDLAKEPIDLLMGAGQSNFATIIRTELKDYQLAETVASLPPTAAGKWIVLEERAGKPMLQGRGNWAAEAFNKAIQFLSGSQKGFLLVQEGAQIDDGGHNNHLPTLATEMIDFDQVVKAALEFADKDGETLVIVTADHETGGLTLVNGDPAKGSVSGHFSTNDHTATPVPVFAYGPRSYLFTGVYENTAIHHKIREAIK